MAFLDNSTNVERQVIELILSVVELEDPSMVSVNSSIKDLGIDSIRFMNLLISLEDIIGRELEDIIEDIEFADLKTVGDIAELVQKMK